MRIAHACRSLALAGVVALTVAACSTAGTSPTPSAASTVPAAAGVTVTNARVMLSPLPQGPDAAYLVITNGSGQDDALIGVTTPIARTAEVHETVQVMPSAEPSGAMSGGMGSAAPSPSGDMGGMMAMKPVARLAIPAGGTVELKPGGYHIMLIDLKEQPKAGSTVQLTLTFEKAGPVTVTADVQAP